MYKTREKGVYLITDSRGLSEKEFYERIETACREGIALLQLREKDSSTAELLERGRKIKEIAGHYSTPFVIDDRVDIALAVGADGVHVGAVDMPVAIARRLLGPGKIVGATAKTVEAAKKAERDGADYVGVGAIYDTTTHANPVRTSVETLAEIKKAVDIDVFAIGGLRAENLDILKGSGVDGVCVVRYLMQSEDVEGDLKRLKEAVEKI